MKDQVYAVGDEVILSERALSGAMRHGEYEVTDVILVEGESPCYQLTCSDQSHHRVANHDEIRPLAASDRIEPAASPKPAHKHQAKDSKPMLTDPALLEL